MSTQINQYLGYGILMSKSEWKELTENFDDDWHEALNDAYADSAFDTKITEINGFSLISDSWCNDFYFYGKCFAKSANESHLETTAVDVVSQELRYDLFHSYEKLFKKKTSKDAQYVLLTVYR